MTRQRIVGFIPGMPIAFARPVDVVAGGGKRRRLNPPRYAEWKRHAAGYVLQARVGGPPLDGPVAVEAVIGADGIRFEARRIEPELAGRPRRVRGDLDNYTKALLDALNGVAIIDDVQVENLTARFTTEELTP